MRIFSGLQPTGALHLGNYIGMVRPCVELQSQGEAIYFITDLHALTLLPDPTQLRDRIYDAAAIYLAAGINPQQSALFIQSQRPEHAELAWVMECLVTMGELGRMTQYKEKRGTQEESATRVGLFTYPALMAADILLYQSQIVPVGEDQTQHVELTRDLAKRFNQRYGETFVIPELRVKKSGARIMGLDDPTVKMSKSAASQYNAVALADDADTIRKKIQRAVTDSGSEITYSPDKPALKNLLNIFSGVTGEMPEAIANQYVGRGYAEFKADLAQAIIEHLAPIQAEYQKFRSDESTLDMILREGAAKVAPIAQQTLKTVYENVGLR